MNKELNQSSYKDFIRLVENMRKFQKAYFTEGRKQSDLIASKKYEKQVDDFLKNESLLCQKVNNQSNLF
jgi:hypothetical protein